MKTVVPFVFTPRFVNLLLFIYLRCVVLLIGNSGTGAVCGAQLLGGRP